MVLVLPGIVHVGSHPVSPERMSSSTPGTWLPEIQESMVFKEMLTQSRIVDFFLCFCLALLVLHLHTELVCFSLLTLFFLLKRNSLGLNRNGRLTFACKWEKNNALLNKCWIDTSEMCLLLGCWAQVRISSQNEVWQRGEMIEPFQTRQYPGYVIHLELGHLGS